MPAQGRLGDRGNVHVDVHGCPACPHPAIGPGIIGSPTVMVNELPALRVDDVGIHAACCGPNTWTAKVGAATVFFNNKAAHRKGDQQKHCGGMGQLMEGSPNVMTEDGDGGAVGGGGAGGASGGAGGGGSGGGGPGGGGTSGGGPDTHPNSTDPAQPNTPRPDVPNTPIEPDEIEIHVVTPAGETVDGIAYELTMPDGSVRTGTADVTGLIKLTGLSQRGDCKLRFPKIDDEHSEQPE